MANETCLYKAVPCITEKLVYLINMPRCGRVNITSVGSPACMDRLVELFCENLQRFLTGKPLLAVIDKQKGY